MPRLFDSLISRTQSARLGPGRLGSLLEELLLLDGIRSDGADFRLIVNKACRLFRGICDGFGLLRWTGSLWRLRCFESDSPGSRPLPSHSMGDSISVAGLKVLAGRAGAAAWAASSAGVFRRSAAVLRERLAGQDKRG